MQYYGHREKLKLIGREHELEAFNRQALKMARQVANETGTLMAGNICNTTLYTPNNDEIASKVLMIAMKEFCSNRSSSVLEQAASSGV